MVNEVPSRNLPALVATLLATGYYFIHMCLFVLEGISLLGNSPLAIRVFGVVVLLSCVAFGIYLYYLASKHARVDPPVRLLNRCVVIPYAIFFAGNIAYTAYLFGDSDSATTTDGVRFSKTRIVLLLPLNESLKPAYEDGVRQVAGFADFLVENPECTRQFEFVVYDHSMNVRNAERIIKQELSEGTQYFVCTMSNVSLPLSRSFKSLVEPYTEHTKQPKLVCAVTSAPTVNLDEGLVYRFYIRSQEEAMELASIGPEKRIRSATFIAVDDDYGRGAVQEFQDRWKGNFFPEGLFIGKTLSADEIQFLINQKIASIPPADREAIFICHYGNGIDNIVTALDRASVRAILLATSTLSINDWQKPIKTILDDTEWYTCVPDYSSVKKGQDDVIRNFTTYVLYRLTQAISSGGGQDDFDRSWRNANYPDNLEVTWDQLDSVIPMRAVHKTEVHNPPQN